MATVRKRITFDSDPSENNEKLSVKARLTYNTINPRNWTASPRAPIQLSWEDCDEDDEPPPVNDLRELLQARKPVEDVRCMLNRRRQFAAIASPLDRAVFLQQGKLTVTKNMPDSEKPPDLMSMRLAFPGSNVVTPSPPVLPVAPRQQPRMMVQSDFALYQPYPAVSAFPSSIPNSWPPPPPLYPPPPPLPPNPYTYVSPTFAPPPPHVQYANPAPPPPVPVYNPHVPPPHMLPPAYPPPVSTIPAVPAPSTTLSEIGSRIPTIETSSRTSRVVIKSSSPGKVYTHNQRDRDGPQYGYAVYATNVCASVSSEHFRLLFRIVNMPFHEIETEENEHIFYYERIGDAEETVKRLNNRKLMGRSLQVKLVSHKPIPAYNVVFAKPKDLDIAASKVQSRSKLAAGRH